MVIDEVTAGHTPLPLLADRVGVVYDSLCDQLRDFVAEAGFTDVVLGISGGIDSALVAALAVDAFGPERVRGIIMPSPFTTEASRTDALELAYNLAIEVLTIPIETIMEQYDASLICAMEERYSSLTRQNLQARIRANILLAFSNAYGWLVLTTGNRSETLVGYTTLHGDMVGAFAPLAPLYKQWVYELARYRNAQEPIIPGNILDKAPSAELASDQTDEEELGSYQILDAVLFHHDLGLGEDELLGLGLDQVDVERVLGMVEKNAFKQRYTAPGASLPVTLRDLNAG
ncbi:MAG: NAD(+) synthase [Coriobacteriia bacterium]|nr:NAD(+) synthase [Coriobacteriia bacterium]